MASFGLILFVCFLIQYSSQKSRLLVIVEEPLINSSYSILPIITIPQPKDDIILEIITMQPTQEFVNTLCRKPRPNLIMDFTTWKTSSETVKKISRFAHIPTITTSFGGDGDFTEWLHLSDVHNNIFLQIKQPADLVPHIVRAIVEFNRFTNAAIVYDDTFVMLHKLKMLLLNMEVRHSILQYKPGILRQLNSLELFNFFIIGSENTISVVLKEACINKYYKRNFGWYGITLEEFGNVKVNCSMARYALAWPIKPIQPRLPLSFINLPENLLPRLTKEFFFDVMNIGMEVAPRIKSSELKELCQDGSKEQTTGKKVAPLVNSMLQEDAKIPLLFNTYRVKDTWNSFVRIEMQMKGYISNATDTVMEPIAEWSTDNMRSLTNTNNMDIYASLIVYKIAVAVQEPFLFPDPTSPFNYSGYCIDLIEEIGYRMGFKFELYIPPGSGYRYDFDAVISEVKNGSAAIGLGSISVDYSRSDIVDFTIPFYELVGMLIMMKIPESSKSFFKIIDVLDVGVWGVLLVLFFITSFLLWMYDKFSPYSYQNNKELLKDTEEVREFTLRECFWFCLTSVTSQGGGEAPRALSSKIVSGIWWLFGFLIVASYTANLAAFLTVSHLESSIESLEDLSRQYKVKYGVVNNSRGYRYFEHLGSNEEHMVGEWIKTHISLDRKDDTLDYPIGNMYRKMFRFMKDSNANPSTLEEAIAKVQSSTSSNSFAYIGDATDIKFAVLTNCDLQAVGEEFAKKFYSLAIAKNSPLKEPLDNALMDLLNERKLERMKNKWWRENPRIVECGNRRHQSDGITIQNVVGVFLLIAGGVVISMIIMSLEGFYEKRKLARQQLE